MIITLLDIFIVLLFTVLFYKLALQLARAMSNSGFKMLVQTNAGKLVVIISSVLLVCTLAFLYIAFVLGC
jgi:hypothetical protein